MRGVSLPSFPSRVPLDPASSRFAFPTRDFPDGCWMDPHLSASLALMAMEEAREMQCKSGDAQLLISSCCRGKATLGDIGASSLLLGGLATDTSPRIPSDQIRRISFWSRYAHRSRLDSRRWETQVSASIPE